MTDLLTRFADPQTMHAMSMGDKLFAGLFTTVLGMGITFLALIILQFIISWMERFLANKSEPQTAPQPTKQPTPRALVTQVPESPASNKADEQELVAAITASLAIMLGTSTDRLIIKNIVKVEDRSPIWNRTGILEQMNNRL